MSAAGARGLELAPPPPGPPARRRTDRSRRTPADRDRLLTMLVMAALLHGLVILGIRFESGRGASEEGVGMEVLLVSDELPESRENADARYLAQRTQQGSGNVTERVAARLPGAPPEPAPAEPSEARTGEPADESSLSSARGTFHTQYRADPFPPRLPRRRARAAPRRRFARTSTRSSHCAARAATSCTSRPTRGPRTSPRTFNRGSGGSSASARSTTLPQRSARAWPAAR